MKKFPVVMEAMKKLPDYYVTVFCPVRAEDWLPQKRERLILIGSRKPFDWRAPVSKKRVALKDIIEPDPVVNISQCVYNRMKGKYRDKPIISDPEKGDLAPTCVAHYAKDQSTRLLKDDRSDSFARLRGCVVEGWRLMVWPRMCSVSFGHSTDRSSMRSTIGSWQTKPGGVSCARD